MEDLKARGVVGVIVRSSQGIAESIPVGVDARFTQHIEDALAAGLYVGAYHTVIAYRAAKEQANFFLKTLAPFRDRLTLGCALDSELSYSLPPADVADNLYGIAAEVEVATGVKPDVYTRKNFWEQSVGSQHDAYFGQCRLWLAAHGAENPLVPRGWQSVYLHQYTNEFEVKAADGKTVRIDMNRVMGEAPAKFTLRHPVDPPATVNARNLFGAHPERYAQFGLSGHDGWDYALALNAPVYTAADGVVKLIAPDDGTHPYGAHVQLVHEVGGETYQTIYAHLNKFIVGLKQGDTVKAGQQLGYAGSTGNSDSVHLHLAVKWDGATARGFQQTLPDGRTLVFEKDLVDPALFLST